MSHAYDLVVIGSGPAGEKAAVKAAYFNHRVALIEREKVFGGAGIQTGTLPSKTLKETALYLSGVYSKGIFSINRELAGNAGIQDFMYRKNLVTQRAANEVERNLKRHDVTVYHGQAEFLDDHTLSVTSESGVEILYAHRILVATGSYPYHPPAIPFDGVRVHDSDTILNIDRFPKSLCVLGAGVIGCEYATLFAAMGIPTYVVNNSDKILGFLDHEIADGLVERMKNAGISILFNNGVEAFEVPSDHDQPITISLQNGEMLSVDMFLFAAGRSGNIRGLHCERAGIVVGPRETIVVNAQYQTNVSHIYAAGDVIGFPALASIGMEQGRVAVSHMFHTHDLETLSQIFPYGIYTVPEVSMVGLTEEQARREGISYGTGYCYYRDTLRGEILGDQDNGFLKLVFETSTHIILGVHIMGYMATEIIHFGLCAVNDKRTLNEIIATVFNYPTLHDLYKYACYDGLGSLAGKKVKKAGEIKR
jgi:NAD(P) transhydrogenase